MPWVSVCLRMEIPIFDYMWFFKQFLYINSLKVHFLVKNKPTGLSWFILLIQLFERFLF